MNGFKWGKGYITNQASCVRLIFVTSVFWDGTQESEPVLDCDIL